MLSDPFTFGFGTYCTLPRSNEAVPSRGTPRLMVTGVPPGASFASTSMSTVVSSLIVTASLTATGPVPGPGPANTPVVTTRRALPDSTDATSISDGGAVTVAVIV